MDANDNTIQYDSLDFFVCDTTCDTTCDTSCDTSCDTTEQLS